MNDIDAENESAASDYVKKLDSMYETAERNIKTFTALKKGSGSQFTMVRSIKVPDFMMLKFHSATLNVL